MRKHLIIALIALLATGLCAQAQGRRGLKINEVMVQNDSNVVDDYGQRVAWIEIFNSTYAPLEISSVFLTTDSANKKMYPVPLGDVLTEIPTRQHVIFWADGKPSRGTFHTNFVLVPGQDNWIGIYDADGRTLIDEVVVPASLPAGHTYARKSDGNGSGPEAWEIRTGKSGSHITPSSANIIRDTNSKVDMFKEKDKSGLGLTVMAMCIVFSALLLLSCCFYLINRIGAHISKTNKLHAQGKTIHETPREERPDHDSGEEIAAIVMALHEHLNAHDQEQTVLTINKVKRAYSPWSSKIYNMRELPHR
ncbi:MAG: OadG family protein [Bacteroidales bacterium]|nr:OadG family protein [Bacteroidales bacterium]